MQECLHGVPLPRATPVPAFLHAPPTASRGPLIPPEFTKVKVAPKSRLIMVLNAAAPAPGAGGVGDAGRWPQSFISPRSHTLYHVTLQLFLLEAKCTSRSLNSGLGHGTCFAR